MEDVGPCLLAEKIKINRVNFSRNIENLNVWEHFDKVILETLKILEMNWILIYVKKKESLSPILVEIGVIQIFVGNKRYEEVFRQEL